MAFKLIFANWMWHCEYCHKPIALPGIVPDLKTLKERGWRYCPHCGKRIYFDNLEDDQRGV